MIGCPIDLVLQHLTLHSQSDGLCWFDPHLQFTHCFALSDMVAQSTTRNVLWVKMFTVRIVKLVHGYLVGQIS